MVLLEHFPPNLFLALDALSLSLRGSSPVRAPPSPPCRSLAPTLVRIPRLHSGEKHFPLVAEYGVSVLIFVVFVCSYPVLEVEVVLAVSTEIPLETASKM